MSTWLLVNFTGSLLLVLQGSCMVPEISETKLAAVGSSILLDAPDIKEKNFIEWEFIKNTTADLILQYYLDSQAPTIYGTYQDRVVFYPQNGSLLLQGLQETDSGVYKATVDLMQNKAQATALEVIEPVPQPELQYSSNLAGSPIKLVCLVPEGTVDSVSWKKDGHPLPLEKLCLLSLDMTKLWIREGEKSDCGSYSCNVSNRITWKEATVTLTVTGLAPTLHHVHRVVVITIVFISISSVSFIIMIRCRRELSSGNEAQKYILLAIHVPLCFSSILLLTSSIIWMQTEGLSAAFILLGLFFFITMIGTAWAAAAVVWRPAALSCFQTQAWYPVFRKSTALTTAIVNLLSSVLLLHNIQQLHERGCSEAVDLVPSYISAAVAVLVMLLLLFCWYHRRKQMEKVNERQHWRDRDTPQVTATMVLEESQGQRQEGE